MPHIITNSVEAEVQIININKVISWKNHKELFLSLIEECDECLLVSPFLTSDFSLLFSHVSLVGKTVELISTCAPRGDDQFVKPLSLRNFGEYIQRITGVWPAIGLDQKLHSKVYIFRKNNHPFAGIVTSANLTESGLAKNNETGILIQSEEALVELEVLCRNGLDYVNLAEWQLDKLCTAAEILSRNHKPSENHDIGLKSILNKYATPSAGNRSTVLRPEAKYYIKVSGVSDRPILPEQRQPIDEPHCILTFAKEPKGISLGDCLLEVAVGGACFLSYYACASAVWEFSDEEKRNNSDNQRWPYYIYANNLSLNYGPTWFENPLHYDDVVSDFNREYPSTSVTAAGSEHFKGAMQMGHSYIRVTSEFGEFVRKRIDKYNSK
ncbi:hypothetical protein CBP51_03110 [Cellvibrio mixtus]|uniref:Restriction endonuclease type II NgoFVII N-terminal domain-containing protein n=1 Tax=Cellvibrio mixtus TaxID=39650 RepID=A0A266Q824_9GAMM|nr:restriction endonuclease PLD domain-containing protein [Cellvibrio mixtus]OZY86034.1 hypothetical protein CBP51_03110 [Cellvibrio mixtus]